MKGASNHSKKTPSTRARGILRAALIYAADQVSALTFGNTSSTAYTYHAQSLRLTRLLTVAGTPQLDLTYGYDKVGNVKTITDTVRSEVATFTYDDLDRLLSASIPSIYSQGWTYNPIGNITQRTDGGTPTAYAYGDGAHKHAVTTVGSQTYGYDANGNMTSRAGDTLTYDAENRLTQVTSGGTITTYAYDGDGRRVKKTVGGTTTFYVGNWYEVTGASVTKYYYFGAQRVAMKQGSAVTYLHGDHLGSTSVTTGANSSTQTYYPYGSVRSTSGTLPTDYTFTGQKSDASAGLMYYGARYYDAALGRFIQADTIVLSAGNPQALNRYAYVRNNPVRYTDSTGQREVEDWYSPDAHDTPMPAETRGEQRPSSAGAQEGPGRVGQLPSWPPAITTPSAPGVRHTPTAPGTPTVPVGVPTPPPGTPRAPVLPQKDMPKYHINWDKVADPLVWDHTIHINAAPVIAAEFGVFFIGATFLPCATEVGCVAVFVMAPTTVPAAVASFTSAYLLGQAAIEYDERLLKEIIEVK